MKQANWSHRRKEPYTTTGVRQFACIRCGVNRADAQWQICSDGNNFRPICIPCDLELNHTVLIFMGHPDVEGAMAAYKGATDANTN